MIRAALILLLLAGPAAAELRVIDGDTVRIDGQRIRLAALDCPELDQPGGMAAKRALETLAAGRTAHLERIGRDRYGRTIARVFLGGRDAACELMRSGHCKRHAKYDTKGEYVRCAP